MSNQIKLCSYCNQPLNGNVPKSKQQILCDECYSNRLLFVKVDKSLELDAPKYRSCKSSIMKYLREDVKEYMDMNDIALIESHQSDNYGFCGDKQRLKLINNVIKFFHLNKTKVLNDHWIDYFITFGLHIFDSDEEFLRHIKNNKRFHTDNGTQYNRNYVFDLNEYDFLTDYFSE